MKRAIITLMICFACLHFSFGQCTDTQMYDIYTPVGSLVNTWLMCEASTATRMANDNYCRDIYPDAQQIIVYDGLSSTRKFNCHGYAWLRVEQGIDRWIGYYYGNADPDIYMADGSYTQVSTETFPGKVFWPKMNDHSAVTTEQQGWLISKWGAYSLCRHRWDDSPYGTSNLKYYVRNCSIPVNFTNQIISTTRTISSCCEIEISNTTIEPGANVTVTSSTRIRLLPGFHAKEGSRFHAKIESCESTSGAALSLVRERNVFDSQDVVPEEAPKPANIISSEVEIYPNPASSTVTITAGNSAKINRIKISNSLGITVLSVSTDNTSSADIDISALAKGIYFVSVFTENDKLHSSKLIKK